MRTLITQIVLCLAALAAVGGTAAANGALVVSSTLAVLSASRGRSPQPEKFGDGAPSMNRQAHAKAERVFVDGITPARRAGLVTRWRASRVGARLSAAEEVHGRRLAAIAAGHPDTLVSEISQRIRSLGGAVAAANRVHGGVSPNDKARIGKIMVIAGVPRAPAQPVAASR
jgi:hypothetical protein